MCGRIFFFFFFFDDDDDESVASLERDDDDAFRGKNNPRPLSLSFHISCLGLEYKFRVSNREVSLLFFSPAFQRVSASDQTKTKTTTTTTAVDKEEEEEEEEEEERK
jgi:hypothetical protein